MMKNNQQVYYMTYKSRMISVDTSENNINAMKKHTENDKKENEIAEIER